MSDLKLTKNYGSMTVAGIVQSVDPAQGFMLLSLLSGDTIRVDIAWSTWYQVLRR
jgi:hypothetical protein